MYAKSYKINSSVSLLLKTFVLAVDINVTCGKHPWLLHECYIKIKKTQEWQNKANTFNFP